MIPRFSLVDLLKSTWSLFDQSRKAILKKLWEMSKAFHTVFPSQEFLAKECGICERTVRNALKELRELGFVAYKKRYNRSNVYYLPDEILRINFKNPKELTHRSEEDCRSRCRLSYVAIGDIHEHTPAEPVRRAHGFLSKRGGGLTPVQPPNLSEKTHFPNWWPKPLRISIFKSTRHFALRWVERIPDEALIQAKEECREYARRQNAKNNPVRNPAALLINRLKKLIFT